MAVINHLPNSLEIFCLHVFFSKDILAGSRAIGGSKNVAHDCDIGYDFNNKTEKRELMSTFTSKKTSLLIAKKVLDEMKSLRD